MTNYKRCFPNRQPPKPGVKMSKKVVSPTSILESAIKSIARETAAIESSPTGIGLFPERSVNNLCKIIDTVVRLQSLTLKSEKLIKGKLASISTEELEKLAADSDNQ
jgi:hypothetical protein